MDICQKVGCWFVAAAASFGAVGAMANEYFTAAAYSRQGLIAQWDGIENVGLGLPHDSAANAWKDLAGSRDLTLVSGNGEFVDNALNCLSRSSGYVTGTAAACTDYKTIEVVCDRFAGDYGFVLNSGAASHIFAFTLQRAQGSEGGACCATTTNRATWAFSYLDSTGDATAGYENGARVVFSGYERWNSGDNVLALGASAGHLDNYLYVGRIYAIRLYDRVLTNQELFRHSVIDAVRFFGAPEPTRRVSITIKGAGVVSVDGTDHDAPIIMDVPMDSTISLKAKADDGNVFLGWSGSGVNFRSDMVLNPELETAVIHDIALTAHFVPSSEKPALGVTDYSYDGLVAFWDGLSNAGIGEPHDSTATVWKDLAGTRDLTIASGKAEFVDNALNCLARDSGYATGTAEACADYKTIEVVCDRFAGDYGFLLNSGVASHIFAFTLQRAQGSEGGACCATTTNRATWAFTYSNSGENATAGYENGVEVAFNGKVSWSSGGGVLALGASAGYLDQYLYSGRIYAIRLYDRVLTPDELVRHSAIDAVRFFGATLPVARVSVTIQGAGAVSVDGVDHHASFTMETFRNSTLTLQARADDGNAFLCWTGSGADFRSSMIPKSTLETTIREDLALTVRFVPSPEKPKHGVTDYSYDGLVAFWDGLSNAGIGVPHDSTTNVWKDLAGSRDLTLVSGNGEFVDNALNCLPRSSGYVTGTAAACTDYKTIEVVCDRFAGDYGFVLNSGAASHIFAFTLQRAQGSEGGACCATTTNRATWAFSYSNSGENATAGYENGVEVALNGKDTWKSGGGVLAFGASAGYLDKYLYVGKVYAVRLYDRVLTTHELLRHSLLDQARYFGVADPMTPDYRLQPDASLALRITASADGGRIRINGGTPAVSNTWWVADGSTVTFEAVPNGGRMLAGWSEPVVGASYVTADTVRELSFSAAVTAPATLRASFEKIGQLQRACAADYVRNGLVAQWDGIENVGLGLPHNSATNVWKDLAGARDLPLVEGRGSFGENALVCESSDVCAYAAGPAARIPAPGTVEIVCTACDEAWSVPIYLDGGAPSQIMSLASGMRFMYGWDFIWSYRRNPTTLSWVQGVSFADGCVAVQTQQSETWTRDSSALTVGGNANDHPYYGRIYSIRVYDRALTEAERLHNYLLDSIRFYGISVPSSPGLILFVR